MSWLVLLGAVYAQDEDTVEPAAQEPSELDRLEEEIQLTEARIRLAEAQLRLKQMESRVEGADVVTPEPEVKPDVATPQPEEVDVQVVAPSAEGQLHDDARPRDNVEVVTRIIETSGLQAGGDVFVQLDAARLDNLHPDVTEDPTVAFQMARVRPYVKGQLGDRASAVIGLDMFEDGAGGFAIRPLDAWIRYESDRAGRLTIGQQLLPFGSVDRWTPDGDYQVPGWTFRVDPVRSEGLIPYRTVGVFWQRDLGEKMSVDLAVSNTALPETQTGKDWSGRLTLTPLPALTAAASVLVGPGTSGETKLMWDGLVEGRAGNNRALVEVFGRQGFGPDKMGAAGALARDFPMDGPALNRVTPAVNITWFDPDTGTDVDEHTRLRLGVTESWGHDHPGRFETGLGYEVLVPDDVDLAIEHHLIVDARLRF